MKQLHLAILFSAILLFSSCRNENQSAEDRVEEKTNMTQSSEESNNSEDSKRIDVEFEPKSDSNLSGNVVFSEEKGEVTMTATITGLEEGLHAIHIHEEADCSAKDGSSAGGHWNPTFEDHGEWGDANGYHRGDIGNFKVDAEGNGTVTFTTDQWCIDCDDDKKNIVGKSVIVHDGVDDFTSQPAGDAGIRVGCATLKSDS